MPSDNRRRLLCLRVVRVGQAQTRVHLSTGPIEQVERYSTGLLVRPRIVDNSATRAGWRVWPHYPMWITVGITYRSVLTQNR